MHQKFQDWGFALLAFAVGLLAVIGVLLFAWNIEEATPWASMGPGDWGVWVGSIGAVGAFLGTIWLATQSERRRRSEQLDLALIKVCEFSTRVSQLQIVAKIAVEKMESDKARGVPTDFRYIVSIFAEHPIWSAEEIAPLVHVKGHLAARLAFLGSQISSAVEEMKQPQSPSYIPTTDRLRQLTDMSIIRLRPTLKPLEAAFYDCLDFIRASGFTEAWREANQRTRPPVNLDRLPKRQT